METFLPVEELRPGSRKLKYTPRRIFREFGTFAVTSLRTASVSRAVSEPKSTIHLDRYGKLVENIL